MKRNLLLASMLCLATFTSFAQLQFFPDAIDFGQVTTGQADTLEVVFTSDITQNITLSAVITPFAVEPQEFFLHKDSVKVIWLIFTPQDLGVYQQTLTATGDVFGEATLPVTGEGIEANIVVTPLNWDFGGVTLNSSDSARFYVSNTGTGDMLCEFAISNEFYTLDKTGIVVPSGEVDSLTVYFTPEFLPEETAVLAITSNDPNNGLLQIPLTGFGINEISGSVSGVWHKDNSPYTLVGNVNVPWDDTLTILPGVEINMSEFNFEVFGKLVCNGENTDSIRFNGTGLLGFSTRYPNDSIQYVVIDGDTTSNEGLQIFTYGIKMIYSRITAYTIKNINPNFFYDDFEDGLGKWIYNGNWGVSGNSYEGNFSLTESPSGNYGNNWNQYIQLKDDLTAGTNNYLIYYLKRNMECGNDFITAQIRVNNGFWQTLGQYNCNSGWEFISYTLSSYVSSGDAFRIKFIFTSDGSASGDGANIDNVAIGSNLKNSMEFAWSDLQINSIDQFSSGVSDVTSIKIEHGVCNRLP